MLQLDGKHIRGSKLQTPEHFSLRTILVHCALKVAVKSFCVERDGMEEGKENGNDNRKEEDKSE